MAASPAKLVRYLRRLARAPAHAHDADAALLQRFLVHRNEDAFAALVARHGTMVLRLCRRLLGDEHLAEDAFQAAFLVLARKAGAIRRPDRLASWLYGVAYRVAIKARERRLRRQAHEKSTPFVDLADADSDPLARITGRELVTALDEEISRLPEVYRLPVILCCLEGRAQEDVACQLGWTAGSVKGRLERGRARLRARLVQRGIGLPAGFLVLDLCLEAAVAGVAPSLASSTSKAAALFATAKAAASAGIPTRVAMLSEGVLRAMF